MFNILFVHGFGGPDNHPAFIRVAEKAKRQRGFKCNVQVFPWDSQKVGLFNARPRFESAIREAEEAALELQARIHDLESSENNYYLVGYSLGCLVIHHVLNNCKITTRRCRGVFFLGAAIPNDLVITGGFLPREASIINYYSPKTDGVLHNLYFGLTQKRAAGSVKLGDRAYNYRCSATHFRTLGLPSEWANMALPILELASINEGISSRGDKKTNVRTRIGDGSVWWNNVIELRRYPYKEEPSDIFLQQHVLNYNHYRLSISPSGSERRHRIAWSNHIAPLLNEIQFGPGSPLWPLHGFN